MFVLGYHMPDDLKDVAEKNINFSNNFLDKGMSGQHDTGLTNTIFYERLGGDFWKLQFRFIFEDPSLNLPDPEKYQQ